MHFSCGDINEFFEIVLTSYNHFYYNIMDLLFVFPIIYSFASLILTLYSKSDNNFS